MEHLVEKLLLRQLWSLTALVHVAEEVHHQILVCLVQIRHLKVDHVVVLNAVVLDNSVLIVFENDLAITKNLLFNFYRRLNSNKTLQLFDSGIRVNLYVVKLVVFLQILNQQS